jgi:DNA-binding transcriptional MerR regulator
MSKVEDSRVEESTGMKGAARRLDFCEVTVRKWANLGDLPSRRDHAGRRVFKISDLEKFAAARRAR